MKIKLLMLSVVCTLLFITMFSYAKVYAGDSDTRYGYNTFLQSQTEKDFYDFIEESVAEWKASEAYKDDYVSEQVYNVDYVFDSPVLLKYWDYSSYRYSKESFYNNVCRVFLYDNPWIYQFRGIDIDLIYEDVKIEGEYLPGKSVSGLKLTFYISTDYLSYDSRQASDALINQKGNEMLAQIRQELSFGETDNDYKAALKAFDLINMLPNSGSDNSDLYSHPFPKTLSGSTSAKGKAIVFKYLMNMCGLECLYISDYSISGYNCWDIVKLNGEWYGVLFSNSDTEYRALQNTVLYDYQGAFVPRSIIEKAANRSFNNIVLFESNDRSY